MILINSKWQPFSPKIVKVTPFHNIAGLTSNKRLLVIKKGYLYYYSKIPKTFKGTNCGIPR